MSSDFRKGFWFKGAVGCAAILTVAVLAVSFSKPWIIRKFESKAEEKLSERGLVLVRKSASWSFWSGLKLRDASLRYSDGRRLVDVDKLFIDFPLRQFLGKKRFSYWRVDDGIGSVFDDQGEMKLTGVELKVAAETGEFEIVEFRARREGLAVQVEGTIQTRMRKPGDPVKRINLNLKPVRAVLDSLDVASDTGPFAVTGKFQVNLTANPPVWNAQLQGKGSALEWKQIPLKNATASANLSEGNSTIQVHLDHAQGTMVANLDRKDWKQSPFIFSGEIRDLSNRQSSFSGSYKGASKKLELASLDGNADLWKIAESIPITAAKLPEKISVQTFPEVHLKQLHCQQENGIWNWSIEGANLKEGAITYDGEHPLVLTEVSADAAFRDEVWSLDRVKARALSGQLELSGKYRHPNLRSSKIAIDQLPVSEFKRWMDADEKSSSKSVLSIRYEGEVNFSESTFKGKGSAKSDEAPIFDVPLLTEVYDLFIALIPGVERCKTGRFKADFTADERVLNVTDFEASGGTMVVSARGKIDLDREQVEGTARGKLTGLPGVVTSPLSRLLEMNVGGPFDDIRVRPLGPAKLVSNAASATVGTAVDTVEETGKVAGTILKEGVKVPFKFFKKKQDLGKDRRSGR